MKKTVSLLLFVLLLCGCSGRESINNKIVPLYIDGQKQNLFLQKNENVAVIVDNVGEMAGVQFYMPNPEEIEQEFTLFVYEFDKDYENSINNGRKVALQTVKTKLQGATQSVLFNKVKAGKYVIIIQANSETLTLCQTTEKSSNEIFLKNAKEDSIGAVIMSVIFEQ